MKGYTFTPKGALALALFGVATLMIVISALTFWSANIDEMNDLLPTPSALTTSDLVPGSSTSPAEEATPTPAQGATTQPPESPRVTAETDDAPLEPGEHKMVSFSLSKATLSAKTTETLAAFAQKAMHSSVWDGSMLVIEGHAWLSESVDNDAALQLAKNRSQIVLEFFVEQGISEANLLPVESILTESSPGEKGAELYFIERDSK